MPADRWYTYNVRTERFGVVQMMARSIAAARTWARGLEPGASVWREWQTPLCAGCESRPCCCGRSKRSSAAPGAIDG